MKEITYCVECGTLTKWGGQTCSRLCSDKLKKKNNREIRVCKVCKKDFEVKKVNIKEICSDECRKIWSAMPENIEFRIKQTQKAVKKKYGVKTTLQLETVKEKIKQKKFEVYGDEYYNNKIKSKQTNLENHDGKYFNNQEKIRETKLKNHGDEYFNNRELAVKTMIELYGVEHAMKL